jgi:hypothetical protein
VNTSIDQAAIGLAAATLLGASIGFNGVSAHSKSDAVLEQVVGRLSLQSTVPAASWSVEPLAE